MTKVIYRYSVFTIVSDSNKSWNLTIKIKKTCFFALALLFGRLLSFFLRCLSKCDIDISLFLFKFVFRSERQQELSLTAVVFSVS